MKINEQHTSAAAKGSLGVSGPEPSRSAALDRAWNDFQRDWLSSTKQMRGLVSGVPAKSRRLVELQLLSQQLHLRSLVAAKAGESVSSSLRRVQQMGSS